MNGGYMELKYQHQNGRWYVIDETGVEGYGHTREDAFKRYFLNRDDAWALKASMENPIRIPLDASIS